MQIFAKVWDPTLTKVGLSAWITMFTNGPGRAKIVHSMLGRGSIWCPGKVLVYGFEVGTF